MVGKQRLSLSIKMVNALQS